MTADCRAGAPPAKGFFNWGVPMPTPGEPWTGAPLSPGSSYGTGGGGRMRLNLATTRAMLHKGLENIAMAAARA